MSLLLFFASSTMCRVFVYCVSSVWLWHYLVILTYFCKRPYVNLFKIYIEIAQKKHLPTTQSAQQFERKEKIDN